MRSLILGACALVLSGPTWAEERLTPRYRQVIGVDVFRDFVAPYYGCPQADGSQRMFNRDHAQKGVVIIKARDGSPAQKAGLGCRDIITSIDGRNVENAERLRELIAAAKDGKIDLTYLTPLRKDDIKMDVTYDPEVKRVTIPTTTLDEVAERAPKAPVTTNFNIADVFGPKFIFDTSSTYEEVSPGRIRYQCSLMHHGDQEFLPIESPLLPYLGITEVFPNIARNDTRTVVLHADVATDGIPVLTTINLSVARRVDADGSDMISYMAKYPHVGVRIIEGVGGKERNWYSWREVAITCFLPQKLSRELADKVKRAASAR